MLKPLWYQTDCLGKLEEVRRKGAKNALVVMATGLGKTVTVAIDVKGWIKQHSNKKMLYLCHQNDILSHARTRFEAIIDGNSNNYGYYNGTDKKHDAKFLFASFQAMKESLHLFKPNEFGYIVVDESHHAQAETYLSVLNYFNPEFKLGLTATPDRADMKDIRDIFGEEIYNLPLERALALGLLSKVDYRVMTDEIINFGETKNPQRLSAKGLNTEIFIPKRDKEIAQIIKDKTAHILNPKIMMFCSSIRHAEIFHKFMPNSLTVHSGISSKEQKERIQAFRDGIISTIITVDKFNEGIDIPDVNVIVFLRSTESETIFYQQLGRGLRKTKDKTEVLVLDFVANCDRIEMVHRLTEKIKKEYEKEKTENNEFLRENDHIIVEANNFNFTETAKNILNILEKIRGGYTKEVLISQLQDLAKKLGRTPFMDDICKYSKDGITASSTPFIKTFGSWNKALKAAGLSINLRSYSKIELIQQLQGLAKELGRTPTIEDISELSKEKELPSPDVFKSSFGSWNKALKAAGLMVNKKSYSKTELIQQLQGLAKELGRTPKKEDLSRKTTCKLEIACSGTFTKAFGSWNKALEASGLTINMQKVYKKSELIQQLQGLAKKLGRTPKSKEIRTMHNKMKMMSGTVFIKAFGSWNKALEASGLTIKIHRCNNCSKTELIQQLQGLAKELGRTPKISDIDKSSKNGRTASYTTFKRVFGSWDKALETAELK